ENSTAKTAEYIDLTFAFGFARLGENDAANRLLQEAHDRLGQDGPGGSTAGEEGALAAKMHAALFRAYEYRIRQALQGRPPSGPLPDEVMARLSEVKRLED